MVTYYLYTVKTMTLLLSLYIMVLACYPCMDQNTCYDEKRNGIDIVESEHHNHSSTEGDHCSPLCICSCCASTVQVAMSGVMLPSAYIPHNTRIVIPYQEKIIANRSAAIWQPPRLA